MEFDYILMTDSDAEMPYSWLEQYDIKAILMPYTMDGKEDYFNFFEGLDMKAFYDAMRGGARITTAQRNIEDFKAFWEPFLKEGKDILYIGLSSELSGTFNCACIARQEMCEAYPERKILLVDTLAISAPQAMIVRAAAEKRLAGESIDAVAAWTEDQKKFFTAFFTVDDLAYLKRGGRVSATTAFFGTMLDIKPILYESPAGKLEAFDKIKGRKKAMRRIVQLCAENIDDPANSYVIVCQADCEKEAEQLVEMIREQIGPKEICVQGVGPVIGSHAGPGTLAICFKAKIDDLAPAK